MHCHVCGFFLVLLILLLKINTSCAGLYDENDEVCILNENNFDETIIGSSSAWMVEFYNSWCGHCIRFAPAWKDLAKDCKGWKSLVKVAALDCAEKENTALCMHYGIGMYPTIIYLSAFSSTRPERMQLSNVVTMEDLKKQMINFIGNHSLSNLTEHQLLPLIPLKSLDDLKSQKNEKAIVIYEDHDSYLGREVALDLYDSTSVVVRRIVSNDSSNNIPSSYLFKKDDKMTLLIRSASKYKHLEVIRMLESKKDERKGLQPSRNISGFVVNERGVRKQDSRNEVHLVDDPEVNWMSYSYLQLYESDLTSALLYSLRQELPLQGEMSRQKVDLILNYLKVLVKYLPVNVHLVKRLEIIVERLEDKKDQLNFSGITGDEWLEIVDRVFRKKDYPDANNWVSCEGSSAAVRGYPCGLWMTFHAITVNAAQEGAKDADCIHALLSIRDYVQNFFGCQECRTNFMKGASKIESLVKTCNQTILFLWRSHNKANARLRGDPSEDPKHPKTIFPNERQCPSCHDRRNETATSFSGAGWDEGEVLKFLKDLYGSSKIVDLQGQINYHLLKDNGRPDSSIMPKVRGDDRRKPRENVHLKRRTERDGQEMKQSSMHLISVVNIFNRYDIGVCMAFYMACILLLIGLYLHFMRKRKSCLTSASKLKNQV